MEHWKKLIILSKFRWLSSSIVNLKFRKYSIHWMIILINWKSQDLLSFMITSHINILMIWIITYYHPGSLLYFKMRRAYPWFTVALPFPCGSFGSPVFMLKQKVEPLISGLIFFPPLAKPWRLEFMKWVSIIHWMCSNQM